MLSWQDDKIVILASSACQTDVVILFI